MGLDFPFWSVKSNEIRESSGGVSDAERVTYKPPVMASRDDGEDHTIPQA